MFAEGKKDRRRKIGREDRKEESLVQSFKVQDNIQSH